MSPGKGFPDLSATASTYGYSVGHSTANAVVDGAEVGDEYKNNCGCDCPRGADAIFCLDCAHSLVLSSVENQKQFDTFSQLASRINSSEDAETHWDSFEASLTIAIDEVLQKHFTPALKIRMAVAAQALLASRNGG